MTLDAVLAEFEAGYAHVVIAATGARATVALFRSDYAEVPSVMVSEATLVGAVAAAYELHRLAVERGAAR